jgi:hypothetical protein
MLHRIRIPPTGGFKYCICSLNARFHAQMHENFQTSSAYPPDTEGSRLATLRLPRHTHHTAQNTKLQISSSPVFQQNVLIDEKVIILS